MSVLESSRVIVIASGIEERIKLYSVLIEKHYRDVKIFTATDGVEVEFKMSNVPPHVLIIDLDIAKKSGIEVVNRLLAEKATAGTAVIFVSEIPDQDSFVDQVVTGQVQFLTEAHNENQLNRCLAKAFNWIESGDRDEYHLRFLVPKEKLFSEGDSPDYVYILRTGLMGVEKNVEHGITQIGLVSPGEFVGEMSHLTGDVRSATVVAMSDCELIQIPMGTLDSVLFSKPAWAKSLMQTLSRRLKTTSNKLAEMKAVR